MKKIRIFKTLLSSMLTGIIILSSSGCGSHKTETESKADKSSVSSNSTVVSKSESSMWYPSSYVAVNAESSEESSVKEAVYPSEWDDNGIFSPYYEKAYKMLREMSLDEKIGQMFYSSCPEKFGGDYARQYHLGGYVLFGSDFEDKSKDKVIENVSSYINSQKVPMTISVDEEGGTVTRIGAKKALSDHEFRSPRELYEEGGIELIKKDAEEKSKLLKSLGIDVNLAPVCDISVKESDFMYDRSLGQNAEITSEFVSAVTEISQNNGVSVTLKHFPGYGNNNDTHTGIAIDNRSYESFEKKDFLPFKAGIDAGAHLVMVSHNIVNCMDSTKPASLSADVHKILREELGFTGIIVTDDLTMDAIKQYSGQYTPAVAAVLAGNDMIAIGNTMLEESITSVREAVNSGVIDEKIIDHAVMRILAWKYSKNMM